MWVWLMNVLLGELVNEKNQLKFEFFSSPNKGGWVQNNPRPFGQFPVDIVHTRADLFIVMTSKQLYSWCLEGI